MFLKDQFLSEPASDWNMPAAYIKLFLQHASTEGLLAQPLLSGSGLELEMLSQSDLTVTFQQTRKVLANANRIIGPGWHLALDRRLTAASHGPLGFAAVTAPKLSASIDVLLRYVGIRAPFLWLTGSQEDEWFVIRLHETTEMGMERMALVETALLALQNLIERPLGREIGGARILFAQAAPSYEEQLTKVFHPQLYFNAGEHSLRLPSVWLEEPCVMYDEAMHGYLLLRCEEEMRMALGILPAEVAVRQALLATPGEFPGLREIAAGLHVSPRTLIRRLKNGRTSYQAILDDVRRTLSTNYLLHTRFTVAHIASLLGYQDPSNFGRAFRSWFDDSPGNYRRRQSK
jgi:AraC-like DNA-binding protein